MRHEELYWVLGMSEDEKLSIVELENFIYDEL